MRVSVCMATYNGEKYLHEQLKSILSQLDKTDEIIISDDSSTDSTLEIINSINDPRIKVICNQKFKSPIFNFENAINYSLGDIIFLSDQDDVWMPDKVKTVKSYMIGYDVVLSNCKIVDSNLNIIDESFFYINKSKKGIINNISKNSYLGCCLAFKRKTIAIGLPFPKDIPMHDIWLGLVFELFFKVKFLEAPLIYYRRHETNASIASENSSFSLCQKILFRFNIVKYIPILIYRRLNTNFN
jgi:glycosyltransferase involved in cell wall biosynthesis